MTFLIFSTAGALVVVTGRFEICRDRHDRRSCKICASCENFPEKQRNFPHNLPRTKRFTHTEWDFAQKLLKQKATKITDINAYGSVSAGREKWPFNVIYFFKVEPPCD